MYVVPPPIPTPPSPTKQPTSAPIIVIPVETQNAYRRAERDESSLKIDEGRFSSDHHINERQLMSK